MPEEQTKTAPAPEAPASKTFTEEDVNRIVQDRLARVKDQFGDYEDLKKFKTEHEKVLEQQTQKQMEEKQEYEKLREKFTNDLKERDSILSQKEQIIRDMAINNALTNEVSKMNGYVEETVALLKNQTVYTEDGRVLIKGKDANGLEKELDLSDGVKNFLNQRPHLVKSSNSGGGGTPPGVPPNGGNQASDLGELGAKLQQAYASNNFKGAKEIKDQISQIYAEKGISRTI